MYISDELIEKLIKEDSPYMDLTTLILGIGNITGSIRFFSREDAVLCGTEECTRIFDRLNIEVIAAKPSGSPIKKDEIFLEGRGSAENLHTAWKICQNIIDYSSGIATKTNRLLQRASKVNPDISILTTRKNIPGTKELSIKAVISGGGFPHRLGLSETILIFKQHMNFLSGIDGLIKLLPEIKHKACEKKILAEVETLDNAITLCKNGIDGIQFDKIPSEILKTYVAALKSINPSVIILAAGGINETNIEDYAESGADAIVTTSVYYSKPIDIGCKIEPFNS
ncbi:MAG: ModD protein [Clostridium sp.]|jgi:molybdenum transport protein|uniref:ModD protein n=1 Tax=Clostridium sp. TaxID=1506 RepID=UPI0025C2E0D6|nr:ModD protein [Clostridium sp.]MCH3965934.1 ModD protein [Clostridium sp.]MCI1715977.1 ModD protein [Clostridium sp.]MCI1800351.1 ModD protein [Clostridium sp.]MCI1814154.1 ModD protein [Clostridium sp.]MCI1871053.1 ModD protein [Clostridium sp.]